MASKDGTTGRGRVRRQTRTSTSIAGDEDEYVEPTTRHRQADHPANVCNHCGAQGGEWTCRKMSACMMSRQDEVWGHFSWRYRIFIGGCHGHGTPFGHACFDDCLLHSCYKALLRAHCEVRTSYKILHHSASPHEAKTALGLDREAHEGT